MDQTRVCIPFPFPSYQVQLRRIHHLSLSPEPRESNKTTSLQKLTPQKGRFNARAQNPLTTPYNRAGPNGTTEPETAFEKDARTRSHLRDEKHAALAVLMDSELLVTYALASREVR